MTTLTIRLPEDTSVRLKQLAASRGMSLNKLIEELSTAIGQDPKRMKSALRPLMEQALANVLAKPARDVLTGPIAPLTAYNIHEWVLK